MQLTMRDWRLPALVGIALVLARLAGGRLPYFGFYVSALVLFGAWLWTRHAVARIDGLIQVESDRMEVGQSLWVRVRLDNDTFLPLPWAEVDDATPQHVVTTDMPRQATSVPVWGSRVINFRLTAKRRGHYPVGPIRVRVGDGFGLFEGYREFTSRSHITVYPRVHQIENLIIPLSQPFGPIRTRERAFEDPSNQAEIREYRPGDNPRHIHWKTSARMGKFMLREYELNATTAMILFPDFSAAAQSTNSADQPHSTEDSIADAAASLAALGLRQKIDVGLVCRGQERFAVTPAKGQRGFREILEVLARVEAKGNLPVEQVLEREAAHLSGRSTLVVITPALTPRLADVLIRLRANHQVMLVLLRRESFSRAEEPPEALPEAAVASESYAWNQLTGLLALRKVTVYTLAANDDIRRLADLRLATATEGVKGWSQVVRPSATRP